MAGSSSQGAGETTTVVDEPRPRYADGDTPMNNEGCKRLAMAVLQQAVSDLQLPSKSHDYPTALAFLTSTNREWARQREFWATCAGMDPDAMSEHALKMVGRDIGAPTQATGAHKHRQSEVWV